jgi:predicted metal-dependent hydrolase
MATTRARDPIRVRRMQFEVPAELPPRWNPARPEWSQVVNAASLLMPYLEPFLIEAIREATPRLEGALREEAKAYVGQEAHHYKQHRRFNDVLLAQGYGRLRAHEERLESDYARLSARPLAFRLAYAAGFETMALALGHVLVKHRAHWFANADPAVSSLVLWHFVEEIEHKRAAFDVYQQVVGRWPLRLYGLVYAMGHTLWRTRQAYVALLREDGRWGRLRTRLALKRIMARLFGGMAPILLESLSPWHDPGRVADPAWMREWVELYARGEPGLARLDTRRVHLSPAAMVRTGVDA